MESFDIWMLLAGIGLLLFGMEVFEDGIKALAGKKMKVYLERYTRGAFKSLTTGTFVTALLQSSSLVTLLLLWFLWAWLISLQNSIWVIIWANIGTTVSSILVSYLWFGEFKISAFALPIIAIGGIMLLFGGKREKVQRIGKLLVWFWLLFIGIWFMKDSVDTLKASFDLAAYKDMSLRWFGLIWVIVTLVIQSSSAMSVMTFAALAGWLITFPASVAIVMWSNIGTTMTGVIASLGGAVAKRQLSIAQVLFNVFSAIVGVLLFYQLIWFTGQMIDIEANPVFANAILNAIFNIFTALLFAPFLAPFTRLVRRIIPDAINTELDLGIDALDVSLMTELNMDTYIDTATKDIKNLEAHVLQYIAAPFGEQYNDVDQQQWYDDIQDIADKLLQYFEKLDAPASIEQWLQWEIVSLLRSAKHIKNVSSNIWALRADSRPEFVELYSTLQDAVHGYVQSPNDTAAMWYRDMLDKYYQRHISTFAALGAVSDDEDLDSASLINMVREIEEAIGRVSE